MAKLKGNVTDALWFDLLFCRLLQDFYKTREDHHYFDLENAILFKRRENLSLEVQFSSVKDYAVKGQHVILLVWGMGVGSTYDIVGKCQSDRFILVLMELI